MDRNAFLDDLFVNCDGKLELRALPSKARAFVEIGDRKGIADFCLSHKAENVYFAVATRDGNGGCKENIRHIPALWVDIDFKDTPKQTAQKKLRDFPLRSSLLVDSGGGFHAYWLLKEPHDKGDIPAIEKVNRQLARALGGDMHACDASRILRMPDTHNMKYTPMRPVKGIYSNPSRYDISDCEFLPDDTTAPLPASSSIITCSRGDFKGGHKSATSNKRNKAQHGVTKRNINFTEGHRDETLFHIAYHLIRSDMPQEEVEIVLNFLASNCEPPFPGKEVQAKIQSALKRIKSRETGMTRRIRDYVSATKRNISVTKAQQSVTKRNMSVTSERAKIRVIFSRLIKEGVIERVPGREGLFRRIDREAEDIDFLNAETETFKISWPFEIERLVETMPGNIIVIAGEIESGKTAFLLNVARMNLHRGVYYFSSEMGAKELRKRLQKFPNTSLSDWKRLKAKSRMHDFHDVIKPNSINIIDFFEIHDEFFRVGGDLKKIHARLKNGIAIIALQKNPGRDDGLGGQRSMEVARLYISLSRERPGGRLKIVKGKNWATDRNPNGLSMRYDVRGGCELIQRGGWQRI